MHPRSRRRAAALASSALLLLAAAGCTEEDPSASPPPSPTEGVTSSPRGPEREPTWRATEDLDEVGLARTRADAPPFDSYLVLVRPARGGTAVLEATNAGRRHDRLAIEAEPSDGGSGTWRADPQSVDLAPGATAQVRIQAAPDSTGPVRVRLISTTLGEVMGELVVPEHTD